MQRHFISTTLLLITLPQECYTQIATFRTEPPPGTNNVLLYGNCSNVDSDVIFGLCSWPEDPFGFLPRLEISYPNGSSEAVSAGNADGLESYCIQRINYTTSSTGFQISTCEVINSATISCLVNGLTSNKITFQERQCGTVSTITPAQTSTVSYSTPTQTPSSTSEISSSSPFISPTTTVLPTTTPPPSISSTELSVAIVVPILVIFAIIVLIIIILLLFRCWRKNRVIYSTEETGSQTSPGNQKELVDSGVSTMPRRSDSDPQIPVEETGQ